ncbi:MAG: hypothetical protein ABFR97_07895 [Thermodesulfobacteriota bacterium]
MILRLIDYLRDHLKVVVACCYVLIAAVTAWGSVVAFNSHHTHMFFEKWPGFWSFFGFAACFGLLTVARWLGNCVKTREDYYDD